MSMSDISKNIKKTRVSKNLSQSQLAEKLNVTRQTISSWECGNSNPDVEMLLKIAVVLETDVNELLFPHGGGKRRGVRIEPLSPKFVIISVISYFVLLIWGGVYAAVPLFSKIYGGGIGEDFIYIIYWGLILLVAYISVYTCIISEYLVERGG